MNIKEKIDAYVLAQGNQVGAGAEFASLLKEIVDSIPGGYTLPPATAQTLGGVKVGQNLSITEEGVLSASGSSEPLIVVGTLGGDGYFVPNEGQPSHADAEAAFLNGTPVLLDVTDENTPFHKKFLVLGYDVDTKELQFSLYTWS